MSKVFPDFNHPATMPKMRPTPKSPSSKKAMRKERQRRRKYFSARNLEAQRRRAEMESYGY